MPPSPANKRYSGLRNHLGHDPPPLGHGHAEPSSRVDYFYGSMDGGVSAIGALTILPLHVVEFWRWLVVVAHQGAPLG